MQKNNDYCVIILTLSKPNKHESEKYTSSFSQKYKQIQKIQYKQSIFQGIQFHG